MKQQTVTGSILLTDSIAMEALSILLSERAGEIKTTFPAFFVQEAVDCVENRHRTELPVWIQNEAMRIQPLGEGGILNGLWYLCEELKSGCEIRLKQIPVRQECIEICERFDINPLYADSAGAYLIASDHGHELLWMLKKAGIEASLIGVLTDGAARIILSGEQDEHIRHLDRPQREELRKLFPLYPDVKGMEDV